MKKSTSTLPIENEKKESTTSDASGFLEIDFNTIGYAGATGLAAQFNSASSGNTTVPFAGTLSQFGALGMNTVSCENGLSHPVHCDLTLQALSNSTVVQSAGFSVNCLLGGITGNSTAEQTAIFFSQNGTQYVMNYGVSHAGNTTNVPMGDQAYCYVSTCKQIWMGDLNLANTNPYVSNLVLPGVHDSGMWELDPNIIAGSALLTAILPLFPIVGNVLAAVVGSTADNIIRSLAVTQKDTPSDLMNMGIRFFDFRPATVTITGDVRHVHGPIPGALFSDFLNQVVTFLNANPTEVVFVQVSDSGISTSIATPLTIDAVNSMVQTAVELQNCSSQTIDDTSVLNKMVWNDLISGGQLVVLNKYSSSYSVNDSYSDGTYQQSMTDPNYIAAAIQNTLPNISHTSMTSLQCQDTASGYVINNWSSFLLSPSWLTDIFLSDKGSVLADTKAIFDFSAYTLLSDSPNAAQIQNSAGIISVINDFADVASVDLCISHTQNRLAVLSPGQQLVGGQSIVSQNGLYQLTLLATEFNSASGTIYSQGNLVLYIIATSEVLWSSGTAPQDVTNAIMQTDGNFVMYNFDGVAVWNSQSVQPISNLAYLILQEDGNLVVYNNTTVPPTPVWNTETPQG